jgi:hypothetical protein
MTRLFWHNEQLDVRITDSQQPALGSTGQVEGAAARLHVPNQVAEPQDALVQIKHQQAVLQLHPAQHHGRLIVLRRRRRRAIPPHLHHPDSRHPPVQEHHVLCSCRSAPSRRSPPQPAPARSSARRGRTASSAAACPRCSTARTAS